jgi:hypothetical protein
LIQWIANDIPFLNQVGMGQAVAEVAARYRDHQPQMRQHQRTRRLHVAFLAEAMGKILLFCLGQQRKAVGGRNIGIQTAERRRNRERQGLSHTGTPSSEIILALLALVQIEC